MMAGYGMKKGKKGKGGKCSKPPNLAAIGGKPKK